MNEGDDFRLLAFQQKPKIDHSYGCKISSCSTTSISSKTTIFIFELFLCLFEIFLSILRETSKLLQIKDFLIFEYFE